MRRAWQSFAVLWPLAADLRRTIAVVVALGVASSLLEGVGVGVVVMLLYALIGIGGVPFAETLHGLAERLGIGVTPVLLLLLCTILLTRGVMVGGFTMLTGKVSSTVASRARKALYANFMHVDYGYVSRHGVGGMIAAIDWEALFVPDLVNELAGILINGCAIVVYGGYLLAIDWRVALLAAVFAVPVFLTLLLSGRLLRPLGMQRLFRYQVHSDLIVASLGAMRTLRLLNAGAEQVMRQKEASDAVAETELAIARRRCWFKPVRQGTMIVSGSLFILSLMWLGVERSAVLAILAILLRALPHFEALETQVAQVFANAAAVINVAETISATVATTAFRRRDDRYDGEFRAIRLEDVTFSYPGQSAPVLDAAAAVFRRGTLSLLVGPSGSGKTTIVNLLACLADPVRGRIMIDGRDLGQIDRGDWLAHTAFAGQDLELVGGTILDNIRLGRPEIGQGEAMEALRLAGALDVVKRLPLGLDSTIGDRGLRLSGGQRQRIALARALARDPTLLILDEAANAVQPGVEQAILAAIRRERPGLTMIVVTHRDNVMDADQAFVVTDGRIERLHRAVESLRL